jgi:hypothetical protein
MKENNLFPITFAVGHQTLVISTCGITSSFMSKEDLTGVAWIDRLATSCVQCQGKAAVPYSLNAR